MFMNISVGVMCVIAILSVIYGCWIHKNGPEPTNGIMEQNDERKDEEA
ncbi:MAG: hypothetical protein Q4D54_07205 [Eubacteriales bacterium]|nr:hypothetical protein [Lachnospiraceae bacterium]MDO5127518.1 hypothetical protein [Eubacteriales bacterium]